MISIYFFDLIHYNRKGKYKEVSTLARGRGKASPQDKEALRIISEKIRELLKEQGKKQIELSRITGIPASTLNGYVKGTSLPVPENLEKIAAFFQVAVADIDPRLRNDFVVIDSEIERLYKQLDEGNQENLLSYGKSLLTHQKERQKIEKQYHSYSVYDSFAAYQNHKQADIVWFDQKIPYDLAFWIHTDSLEPKYEKGAVVLIKQTYYDQAGAIYAIDFDGQTLIKRVFREANGIRLVSLNKKYSDQIIPLDEEPGVIGKVIDGFVPLDLEEIK